MSTSEGEGLSAYFLSMSGFMSDVPFHCTIFFNLYYYR